MTSPAFPPSFFESHRRVEPRRTSEETVQRIRSLPILDVEPVFLGILTEAARENQAVGMSANAEQADLTSSSGQLRSELAKWFRATLHDDASVESVLNALAADDAIEVAEPNYYSRLADLPDLPNGTTDPMFPDQWHHIAANVPATWTFLKDNGVHPGGQRDVVVAVIDTGVDYLHPDLAGNMWVNPDEIPNNDLDDDGNGFIDDIHGVSVVSDARSETGDPIDLHGHGTHVAGIIAAQAYNLMGGVGAAFNTQIMAVRSAQQSGVLANQDVAEGILYAVDHGADVINMSFGGARSQLVQDALAVAFPQAVLVAAAGNDGKRTEHPLSCAPQAPFYPAAHPFVVGVMAAETNDLLAHFSNYDPCPDTGIEYEIAAPGVGIRSTLPGDQYAAWSGTSMAAPVVSGTAALLRSFFDDPSIYSSRFLMAQIVGSGNNVPAFGPGQPAPVLDAFAAMTNPPTPGVTLLENWLFDDQTISVENDEDGRVDSGETLHLGIELINRGGAATNVVGTLQAVGGASGDPNVTIGVDMVTFGGIGAFATADNGFTYDQDGVLIGASQPFEFTVSPDAANDHIINFELTLTYENGFDIEDTREFTRTSAFTYRVQRGKEVPRLIAEDLTLTSDEFWIVGQDVLVDEGATLTIEAGTQVQWGGVSDDPFNPGPQHGSVTVRGNLQAHGTQEQPIAFFTSEFLPTYVTIQVDGGRADLSYVTVRNPNFTSVPDNSARQPNYASATTIDHGYFDADRAGVVVEASKITNTIFHKLDGRIVADTADTVLFDSGDAIPQRQTNLLTENLETIQSTTAPHILRNSVFLQDNENNSAVELPLHFAIRENFATDGADVDYFEHPQQNTDDTFVLLSVERVSLQVAELVANYFGGHVMSIGDQSEADELRAYLETVPQIRSASDGKDVFFVGAEQSANGDFEWVDGTPFQFSDWSDGQPTNESPGAQQLLQVLERGGSFFGPIDGPETWGWKNVLPRDGTYRFGPARSYWVNLFVLQLPGQWTEQQLMQPVDSGQLLTHIRDNYEPDITANAFLSKYWDPQPNRWMSIKATEELRDGYVPLQGNYWGTDSTFLIDHVVKDFVDDFDSALVDYGTPSQDAPESAFPFVEDVLIDGESVRTVPTIGSGPARFTIRFNRDMDTSEAPFVAFGPAVPFTDFRIPPADTANQGWIDAQTWEGELQVTPVTGDGFQLMRILGGVAADDPWLVSGDDTARFRFEIQTMGVAALTLQAEGTEGGVDLDWQQDDFDLLAGYNLYRSDTVDGVFERINETLIPVGTESFRDEGLGPAETKHYRFTVVRTDLTESALSNTATGTTVDTIAPTLQHSPVQNANAGDGIRLTATASDNVGVADVAVHYRTQGTDDYTRLAAVEIQPGRWTTTIRGSHVVAAGLEYFIVATDTNGGETFSTSPGNPHQVVVREVLAITSVSPSEGPIVGGDTVTISGTEFQDGASVMFGNLAATNINVISENQITAVSPVHVPGTVDIRVINPDNSSVVRVNAYRFVDDSPVISLPDFFADFGTVVEVPLEITNASGLHAADLEIQFDSTVLSLMDVERGDLTANWSMSANTQTAGQAIISMADAQPVSGDGTLLRLQFAVNSPPPATSELNFVSVVLNDGAIMPGIVDGQFAANGLFEVSGSAQYFSGGPIPSVDVYLDAPLGPSASTAGDGTYSIGNVATGNHNVTVDKQNDATDISSHDAAEVLKAAAALRTLSENERRAADVNHNGHVSSVDASLILQHSVGLQSLPFPGAGTIWDFVPASYHYDLVNTDLPNQDFVGVLIGDVTGSWKPPVGGAMLAGGVPDQNSEVRLSFPSVRALEPTISMPLRIEKGPTDVHSLDLEFEYDSDVLQVVEVRRGSAAEEMSFAVNAMTPGLIRVGLAGANPIPENGDLLTVVLEVIDSASLPAHLEVTRGQINEGLISSSSLAGLIVSNSAGDFNLDGQLDLVDVEMFCSNHQNDPGFDLTGDEVADSTDLTFMVETLLNSTFGDANMDGVFDSKDLVQVFRRGEYEDDIAGNSTWRDGDWDCDGEFGTSDLVLAFRSGYAI